MTQHGMAWSRNNIFTRPLLYRTYADSDFCRHACLVLIFGMGSREKQEGVHASRGKNARLGEPGRRTCG